MSEASEPAASQDLEQILIQIRNILQPGTITTPTPGNFHRWKRWQEEALEQPLQDLHPFEDVLVMRVRELDCAEAKLVLTLKYWGLARRVYNRYRESLLSRLRDRHVELTEVIDIAFQVLEQLITRYDPTKKLPLAAWLQNWTYLRIQRQLWRLARRYGVVPKAEDRLRGLRAVQGDPEANTPVHNLSSYLTASVESRGHLLNLLKADFPGLSERSTMEQIIQAVLRSGKHLDPHIWPRRRKFKPEAAPQVDGDRVPLVILQDDALSEFLRTLTARNQVRRLKWGRANDRRRQVFEAIYPLNNHANAEDKSVAAKLGVSRQDVSRARLRAVELVMKTVLTDHQERIKEQNAQ